MRCPFCDSFSHKVLDKRKSQGGNSIRRRRECLDCQKRFTTYERIETGNIMVVKKDCVRESFNREKILNGIRKATEKRPVSADEIDAIVDSIETTIRKKYDKEVDSRTIGKLIMDKLKQADKVAYIRFASVYKDFRDVESFEQEIKKLKK